MISRQHGVGGPESFDGSHLEDMDTAAICIWCGQQLSGTDNAASFLFLARRGGTFGLVEHWPSSSRDLAGQQFFCHASCFIRSVPDEQQPALQAAVEE